MMFHYTNTDYKDVAYGDDMKAAWFGGDKPKLAEQNSMINLPYIVDGDAVITQSNSCLLHLGQKLGVDKPEHFIQNHQVLDQVMDLRNDLMKIVYPFGAVKTKEEFPAAAAKHMDGAKGHFTKLEGFCKGKYMCGDAPQSGDFHVFEMIDQHMSICDKTSIEPFIDAFPKLKALHAAMKAEPTMSSYFAADCYTSWAQNNGLFTHFTGHGEDFAYGPSVTQDVTF